MVKLSELTNDTQLALELYGDVEVRVIDKASFRQDYLEDKLEKERIAGVYLAVENPAKFTVDCVHDVLWHAQDHMGQYDDWEEDMFETVKDSIEVENFLALLNRVAKRFMSYEFGEEVEVDE